MSQHTTATARTTEWTIDPVHSQVEFAVRHLMSKVKGHFSALEGSASIDEGDVSSSSVKVEIDAATIDTRNEDRDTHLRSADFFDVENHPAIRFRSKGIDASDDDLQIAGDLTIRGETRPVTLEVEKLGSGIDPWGNERLGFHATTTVDRKEFGLTWNQALETGGFLVGDEVSITLDVQLVKATDSDG